MSLTSLRLHQAPDEEPASEPEHEPETAVRPAVPPPGHALTTASGDRVNVVGQVIVVVRHAFRTAGANWRGSSRREGGWFADNLAKAGPSVNDQRDYLRDRKWLPDGHEGGAADRIGEAFYVGIGIPGVAIGNAVKFACMRLFRFTWGALAGWAAVFLTLKLPPADLPLKISVIIPTAPVVLLAGWVALVGVVLAVRRRVARWADERRVERVTPPGDAW